MHFDHRQFEEVIELQRRATERHEIQCRARIRIGDRHFAGYLHNISVEGAKLRTVSPIRKTGRVMLTLPDLSPMPCELRWNDNYNAGVRFEMPLSREVLAGWAQTRVSFHLPAAIDVE